MRYLIVESPHGLSFFELFFPGDTFRKQAQTADAQMTISKGKEIRQIGKRTGRNYGSV